MRNPPFIFWLMIWAIGLLIVARSVGRGMLTAFQTQAHTMVKANPIYQPLGGR